MREIKASEFKAKCLKLMDEVNETGEALIVTKYGKPLVRVEPNAATPDSPLLGSLSGLVEIADPEDDLEAWDDEMVRASEKSLERLSRETDV